MSLCFLDRREVEKVSSKPQTISFLGELTSTTISELANVWAFLHEQWNMTLVKRC